MEDKAFDKWIDLTGIESQRTYHYPDMDYTIDNPVKLYVKKSGSHKVIDAKGKNHYMTKGFRAFSFNGTYQFNVSDDPANG